jgi:predicted transcriptional regulator of viral defense system
MLSLEHFFQTHPVFTSDELAVFHRRHGSGHSATRQSLLGHHESKGRIVRVRRGLYAVVPTGVDPDAAPVDPYLVAAKLAPDAVLAYHTALELHGRAHSVFEQFQFLTNTAARATTFRSYRFQPVRMPLSLKEHHKENFGVQTTDRLGLDVRVTTLERTCVDILDRPDLAGGWEEVWRSIESVPYFDLDEVVEYAILLDRATTVAKVGYFLESNAKRLMVEPKHLEELRARMPKAPHYVDRQSTRVHRFVRAWNLVVPAALADRSWGEVG